MLVVASLQVTVSVYKCYCCSNEIGLDAGTHYVRLEISERWPYGEAVVAASMQDGLPRHQVWGFVCLRCAKPLHRIFEAMRSNVALDTKESS